MDHCVTKGKVFGFSTSSLALLCVTLIITFTVIEIKEHFCISVNKLHETSLVRINFITKI